MKVISFGVGIMAAEYAAKLVQQGHEILCFVDNDPAKQGKTITLEMGGGQYVL